MKKCFFLITLLLVFGAGWWWLEKDGYEKGNGFVVANIKQNEAVLVPLGNKIDNWGPKFTCGGEKEIKEDLGIIRIYNLEKGKCKVEWLEKDLEFETQEKEFRLSLPVLVYGQVKDENGQALVNQSLLLATDDQWFLTQTDKEGWYWFGAEKGKEARLVWAKYPEFFLEMGVLNKSRELVPTLRLKGEMGRGRLVKKVEAISLPTVVDISEGVAVPKIAEVEENILKIKNVYPKTGVGEEQIVSIPLSGVEGLKVGDLWNDLEKQGIEVEQFVGIDKNGNFKQFLKEEAGGGLVEIGDNFAIDLNSLEALYVLTEEGIGVDWEEEEAKKIEEIKGKITNLSKGEATVAAIMGEVVKNTWGEIDQAELVKKIMEGEPRLAGLLLSYINEETGLVESFYTAVEAYTSLLGESSLGRERVEKGRQYLLSVLNNKRGEEIDWTGYKAFSWTEYGEDLEKYCQVNKCCQGKKQEENPSGQYPPGYQSPGPNGGMYQCRNGQWEESSEQYCFQDESCQTHEVRAGCEAVCETELRRCGEKCATSISPAASGKPYGSPTKRYSSPTAPLVSRVPTTKVSPKPKSTSMPIIPTAKPSKAILPTGEPVSQKGRCVQKVTGKGCGKLGIFSGCENINETQIECTLPGDCTVQNCEASAWANARSAAADKGATLDENKTVIRCEVTFTGGSC